MNYQDRVQEFIHEVENDFDQTEIANSGILSDSSKELLKKEQVINALSYRLESFMKVTNCSEL